MKIFYEMFRYFTNNKQRVSELAWKHWYHRHGSDSLLKSKKQILDACVARTNTIKIKKRDYHGTMQREAR